jgi:hypothetical protein
VCDAAARPFHWNYNAAQIQATIGAAPPEFWPVNQSPYYNIPTGANSCYYDLNFTMLKALPLPGEPFDQTQYLRTFMQTFGPGSSYYEVLHNLLIVSKCSFAILVICCCHYLLLLIFVVAGITIAKV